MEGSRPPRRHLRRRAGVVAPEEEEDHVLHRRHGARIGPHADAVHDAPAQRRAKAFEKAEPAFRDIQQYLSSLEPPKYPFAIDEAKAAKGEAVFTENCAKCHGTYGEKWTYPNKVIPLDEIGTDPKRYEASSAPTARRTAKSWFGQEKGDGIADGSQIRADRRLSGPAARRHLGHRPVPPQRQRADALRRAELEVAAQALHALASRPTRRTTTRRGSAGRSRS